MYETIQGYTVFQSEQAMVLAYELTKETKSFCTPAFIRQFNEWSERTFGKKPGCYVIKNRVIMHPVFYKEMKKNFSSHFENKVNQEINDLFFQK